VVGVVGLGYVGLPLALRFAEVGYRVLGFDIDPAKVEALNAGRSYIERIPAQRISQARQHGFEATGRYARAAECDAIAICVPTPLDRQRQPDLSFVTGTVDSLLPHLRADQLLVLESTTWPGTTEEVLRPRIESRGLKIGDNFHPCFSPEREGPGNPRYATQTIPDLRRRARRASRRAPLYGQAIDRVVPVGSDRVAEMAKLLQGTSAGR
jgi:UDP-N-acetyl-D-glucosamine dehydrogenase